MSKFNIYKVVNDSPAVTLLAIIGTILAAFEASFSDLSRPVQIGIIIFAVYLAYQAVGTYLWRRSFHELAAPDPSISPFAHKSGWQPWPRSKTVEFSRVLDDAETKHTLLVAPSGAGKTILTGRLLPDLKKDIVIRSIDEYHEFLADLASNLKHIYNNNEIFSLLMSLEARLRHPNEEDIHEEITKFEKMVQESDSVQGGVIIFDQAERLASTLRRSRSNSGGSELYASTVSKILDVIRRDARVRTVFSIRSTDLFESFVYIFDSDDEDSKFHSHSQIFYLWGMNREDDEDFYPDYFEEITEALGSKADFENVLRISRFGDQKGADTFGLRLAIYLFSIIDKKVRPKLYDEVRAARDTGDLIDVLFDAAYEHYALEAGAPRDRSFFDIVVFSLAADTKASGAATSLERLARLAHHPKADIEELVVILTGLGVLQERSFENVAYYRFAHDSIADYIFQDEGLSVHSRAIDGIRALTEASVETDRMVEVLSFPSAIESSRYGWTSISYVSVVLFSLFGVFRIVFPEELFSLYNFVFSEGRIGEGYFNFFTLPAYYVSSLMYVPHFLVHVLWVSYVDRMNRSYLQYVATPAIRAVANFFAPLGVVLGVLVAYTPQLFVVPIVTVGFMFGVALYFVSRQSDVTGEIREITEGWGFRSAVNVIVVVLLALVAVPLFSGSVDLTEFLPRIGMTQNEGHLSLILLESFALYWFWMHIRDEQNRPKAWAANLSLFDKGRMAGWLRNE